MSRIRRIYITGFAGSGKTTAGKKLADALGWSFDDLDEKIERETGKSINEIFSSDGEEYFRRLEYESLRNIKSEENIVIAVGGGAPCYSDNIDYMNSTGIVIYLEMTAGQLRSRLEGRQAGRPLLKGLSGEELNKYIAKKLAEREPFYSRARIIIDGVDPDISSMADRIKGMLKKGAE